MWSSTHWYALEVHHMWRLRPLHLLLHVWQAWTGPWVWPHGYSKVRVLWCYVIQSLSLNYIASKLNHVNITYTILWKHVWRVFQYRTHGTQAPELMFVSFCILCVMIGQRPQIPSKWLSAYILHAVYMMFDTQVSLPRLVCSWKKDIPIIQMVVDKSHPLAVAVKGFS